MPTAPLPKRWLDRLLDLFAVLGALCILAVCVIMILMSLSRETAVIFKGGDDIVAWLCAASAFLVLGQTFQHGGIVRVEMLLEAVGPRRRWVLEVVSLTVCLAFAAYAAWALGTFAWQSWDIGDVSQGQIVIPLWMPQSFAVLGIIGFLLAVADEWLRVLRRQKPRYQLAQEAKLAAGDFGETV
ncbi:TRAP transporter small permease subunit [Cupriavidus oxalaticus]|jgi:TRAP-type C4-dicarboxylate transport system permease small subunit|nr:TRAP transporter small permease [Cupriavidus oxalaticus]QEZ46406.1 TRAP transporter small permease [Cupriavidus oxalaticus]QRQ86125.1 TRAP transporter small permease [Cupriavidus oxalaticus]QRQ95548.1 TRAP transporter small permease [Cupriavidus oxalaticus]WQD84211.1 TRAP transporter small permease [Cupriavidus oxalaticus]